MVRKKSIFRLVVFLTIAGIIMFSSAPNVECKGGGRGGGGFRGSSGGSRGSSGGSRSSVGRISSSSSTRGGSRSSSGSSSRSKSSSVIKPKSNKPKVSKPKVSKPKLPGRPSFWRKSIV